MYEDIVKQYDSERTKYEKLEQACVPLLQRLAEDHGLSLIRLESRVKTKESLQEKLGRPDKSGKYNTLEDVKDICGLRVILLDTDECKAMVTAVRANFDIDEKNSVDKTLDTDEDRFGYASTHLVIRLEKSRSSLFEYKDICILSAEVQIRSVLQHAWAVIDWKSRYKSEVETPLELRRKLFRVSALLEAADETFLEIKNRSLALRLKYTKEIRVGDSNISINRDTLEIFMEQSPVFANILKMCDEMGIKYLFSDGLSSPGPWRYLINSLHLSGVKTIDQLEEKLKSVDKYKLDMLRSILDKAHFSQYGPFTFLRNLVLTTLSKEQRQEVIEKAPTTPSKSIEESIFLAEG